jgi:hypothetical protein
MLRAQFVEGQDVLARCMKDGGFPYSQLALEDSVSVVEEEYDSRFSAAYIETYGFGMSTLRAEPPAISDAVLANDATVTALSPSGQASYMTTLQLCQSQAAAVSVDTSADIDRILSQLQTESNYLAAVDGWARCAASVGFPFASYDAASEHFAQAAISTGPGASDAASRLAGDELSTALALKPCTVPFGEARAKTIDRLLGAPGG